MGDVYWMLNQNEQKRGKVRMAVIGSIQSCILYSLVVSWQSQGGQVARLLLFLNERYNNKIKMFHFWTDLQSFRYGIPSELCISQYQSHIIASPDLFYYFSSLCSNITFAPHQLYKIEQAATVASLISDYSDTFNDKSVENQVIAKEKRKDVKKDEKPPLQQKYGRNIGSNIIHLIFRFIKQEEKMRKKIEAVIERDQMTIKTEEFYLMLQKEEDKLEVYIPTKKMRRLWRGPQGIVQHVGRKRREAEFSKILRILGKYYLMNYHLPYAYNSNKIKQASKRLHSQEIRRILAF